MTSPFSFALAGSYEPAVLQLGLAESKLSITTVQPFQSIVWLATTAANRKVCERPGIGVPMITSASSPAKKTSISLVFEQYRADVDPTLRKNASILPEVSYTLLVLPGLSLSPTHVLPG